jgi:predicted phosphoadenosine phosphosulfate sulfurtransferase
MPRAKKYLDIDVVTAARQRIEHIYDTFDSQMLMWSGGKDSSACLQLLKEFHEKEGLGPIDVVFRHEEAINPSVLRFVASFMDNDWMNLHWLCLPLKGEKFVLGKREGYFDWDPDREWITEQPEWAITGEELGVSMDVPMDQWSVDNLVASYLGKRGRVANFTGIRASESLVRFRSVTQKLNENYINNIEHNEKSPVKLCKPVYDWEQNDVFKYLNEAGVEWCPLYESQNLAGMGLRVSSALHPMAAKKISMLRNVEPEFYQRIVDVFPEMMDQDRYWGSEFDSESWIKDYAKDGEEGVLRYIKENVKPEHLDLVQKRLKLWKRRNSRDPDNYPWIDLLKAMAYGKINQRLTGRYVNSKSYQEGKQQ